jgi:undecaprenyl-diphosphatase
MDTTLLLKALILGIVEGLTEFLPISSTGHLILAGDLLDFNDETGKVFEIVIQFGAILAVVWEYRARLWETIASCPSSRKAQRFLLNVAVAFLPLAILGLLFHKTIKAHLFNPVSVATAFIVGGLIIFWAEKRAHRIRVPSVDDMSLKDALLLGFIQAFALIPGTSRSGATIIGGLLMGLSRKAATEFSFFWRSRRSGSQPSIRSIKSGPRFKIPISACGLSDLFRHSSRHFYAYAGSCDISRHITSSSSPGTGLFLV